MPILAIFVAAVAVAVTVFVFARTAPVGGEFWYGHPWQDLISAWVVVLVFTALFAVYAILEMRRTSTSLWFAALAASSLPMFAALWPVSVCLNVAKHSGEWLDAGGDVPFQISLAERIFFLGLAFSVILAGMAAYGYFARRKA